MYETVLHDMQADFDAGIAKAARIIKMGDVVAFPTETVYGLGADATRVEAVRAIFAAKGRPVDNPLIVHIAAWQNAFKLAHVTENAQRLMEAFWPGPLTVVLEKRSIVPYEVTAGLSTVGLRMPDNEVALALIEEADCPIAAPSANLSGRPSPTTAQDVFEDLNERIPLILDGGSCLVGVESTVISLAGEIPVILRPGAITPGMIQDVIGKVRISDSVLNPLKDGQTAESPGMKHTHYSPKAKVYVIEGNTTDTAQTTIDLYHRAINNSKKCLILATNQTSYFYGGCDYVIMGNRDNPASVCQSFYALLRQADRQGYDQVLLEALPPQAMGLAYMNRALRAAGFEVVQA